MKAAGMSCYRLEIRPSVEKTLRKIRDAKFQQRLDEMWEYYNTRTVFRLWVF